MSSAMNREQKMKVARELFENTSMTREQYKQFCLLAEELDLTVADTESWNQIAKTLEEDFKPFYINK